jgi:hypothetical protein
MLKQAMRAAHVEEPLPEISKVDVVGSDSPISSNVFADVWMVDRSYGGELFLTCVTDWCVGGLFRHREAAKESGRLRKWREYRCGESMTAVTKRTTRMPCPIRVLIAAPPLDLFVVLEGEPGGSMPW